MEDGGMRFAVHVIDRSMRRQTATAVDTSRETPERDPFLPYERELFVCDVSETHLCLLNKYPVVPDHILIVTRAFEEQESPLTKADFAATWACLAGYGGLAFYNSGAVAGASQRHKHLQIVKLGSAETREPPIEALLRGRTGADAISAMPFRCAIAPLDMPHDTSPANAAERLHAAYLDLLDQCGLLAKSDGDRPAPYNMLLTHRWMLIVPRTREHWETVSVNALGFAGALLVQNEAELEAVRRAGPMRLLAHVTS
jgi:ATP adenylyltransferase